MKLGTPKDQQVAVFFEEIEAFFVELLRRIPAAADPGDNAAAQERLFSAPVKNEGDDFNQDWRDFIEPELRDLFRSARETVEADLSDLPPLDPQLDYATGRLDSPAFKPARHKLEIPRKHLEAWLRVLNQARLVIAAKRNFGEREMDEDLSFPPGSERDLDLFRIHFYDFVQQILLRELGFE